MGPTNIKFKIYCWQWWEQNLHKRLLKKVLCQIWFIFDWISLDVIPACLWCLFDGGNSYIEPEILFHQARLRSHQSNLDKLKFQLKIFRWIGLQWVQSHGHHNNVISNLGERCFIVCLCLFVFEQQRPPASSSEKCPRSPRVISSPPQGQPLNGTHRSAKFITCILQLKA